MTVTTTTPMASIVERDLLEGCLAGRRSSQEQLYQQYSAKMFAICLRYSSDYHSAEDILQEGFVKIFNNLTRFRGEGSFEGWMKRIFVNTAIEHYRKHIRFDATVELPAEANNLPNDAYASMNAKELMEVIQKLSPGYRTIFNMYVIEGFSHKEISETLKIAEGTSKSQLARARGMLQKLMSEH